MPCSVTESMFPKIAINATKILPAVLLMNKKYLCDVACSFRKEFASYAKFFIITRTIVLFPNCTPPHLITYTNCACMFHSKKKTEIELANILFGLFLSHLPHEFLLYFAI